MNAKQIVTLVLVVFVIASIVYLVAGESRRGGDRGSGRGEASRNIADEEATGSAPYAEAVPGSEAAADAESTPDAGTPGVAVKATPPAHKVVAYYFHGTRRCRKCLAIEAYTKEAIEKGFPSQLGSGVLEFRAVNVDEPENGHFIGDYELTTKSVVLSDLREGAEERWKNLDLVWEYVGDKEVFIDYIRRETEDYLGDLANE
jgi:hypothetical protein